jgi:hypothetical protein
MKNIHVLPTNKPSRLHFDGELFLSPNYQVRKRIDYNVEGRNIYITSDEEIKEGDWGLSKLGEIIKFHSGYDYRYYAKIILTTEQDLIKDGVQAIDDEFLEWFVKNPICESVKFNTYPIGSNGNIIGTDRLYPFDGLISNFRIDYKIIIPQEESKQETLEQTAVEWLIQKLSKEWQLEARDLYLINQAKEMEKQQVIKAYGEGKINGMYISHPLSSTKEILAEQYYNETFKSK